MGDQKPAEKGQRRHQLYLKGASVLNEVEFCLRIIGICRPQNYTLTSHFRETQAKPGYVEIESKETPTQIYQYLLCKIITHFRGTLAQYGSHIQLLTKEKQTFCEALKDHQQLFIFSGQNHTVCIGINGKNRGGRLELL